MPEGNRFESATTRPFSLCGACLEHRYSQARSFRRMAWCAAVVRSVDFKADSEICACEPFREYFSEIYGDEMEVCSGGEFISKPHVFTLFRNALIELLAPSWYVAVYPQEAPVSCFLADLIFLSTRGHMVADLFAREMHEHILQKRFMNMQTFPAGDTFYDAVGFKGAFGNEQWLAGWSYLAVINRLATPERNCVPGVAAVASDLAVCSRSTPMGETHVTVVDA